MVSRKDIEGRIRAYEFALYDLALYQDSHPADCQAQKLRHIYNNKLRKLIDEYEQYYGKRILTHADAADDWHEWTANPWPWDNCANKEA